MAALRPFAQHLQGRPPWVATALCRRTGCYSPPRCSVPAAVAAGTRRNCTRAQPADWPPSPLPPMLRVATWPSPLARPPLIASSSSAHPSDSTVAPRDLPRIIDAYRLLRLVHRPGFPRPIAGSSHFHPIRRPCSWRPTPTPWRNSRVTRRGGSSRPSRALPADRGVPLACVVGLLYPERMRASVTVRTPCFRTNAVGWFMPLFTILSIDGGGIRGIIPAMILAEIERRTGRRIAEMFDLIAGTSTGGILALGLTVPQEPTGKRPRYEASQLVSFYEEDGKEIFRSFWRDVVSLHGLVEERYPSEPIEGVLQKYLGEQTRLSQALTEVLITSYEIETCRPFFFTRRKARAKRGMRF